MPLKRIPYGVSREDITALRTAGSGGQILEEDGEYQFADPKAAQTPCVILGEPTALCALGLYP